MDDALDPNDPVVRDLLQQNPDLSSEEGVRLIQEAIEASDIAKFICPRDQFHSGENVRRDAKGLGDWGSSLPYSSFPRKLGSYTITKLIGRGGFSSVYAAKRDGVDTCFAVKVFNQRWLDAIERLEIERLVLAKLRHPNLVSAVDFGQSPDGAAYLVMPLIDGVRIDEHASTRNLGYCEIAHLFAQLASGLQYAHERGIIHRDLKPGNILVSNDGVPVVTDFGLAKQLYSSPEESQSLPSITATGAILGTLGYLAPEQIAESQECVTSAVDVYGLGATLYRVLTGHPPGESRNLLKALRESQTQRATFSRDRRRQFPRDLRAICLKCLEKSPGDRYASMRELREDLQDFADGKTVRIRRVPWKTRMKRWIQTEPLTAVLSLGLVAVIFSALLITVWFWRLAAKERTQVKAMLATAREILNDGDRVAERSLGIVPGTLEYRLERLQKSVHFFDRLTAYYPDDTELLKDSAVSNYRLATVAHSLGNHELARTKIGVAENQFIHLIGSVPGVTESHFDLFHCYLTRIYIESMISSERQVETADKADRIITELVEKNPSDKRYRDAQICLRLITLDTNDVTCEQRLLAIYDSAVKLKHILPSPCLEWRHAGTAARKLTSHYLEHFQHEKADSWLTTSREETLDFLKRPDTVPGDRTDWIEYLELAAKLSYFHGDNQSGDELRAQWRHEIQVRVSDRPGFSRLLNSESVVFDEWLKKHQESSD